MGSVIVIFAVNNDFEPPHLLSDLRLQLSILAQYFSVFVFYSFL